MMLDSRTMGDNVAIVGISCRFPGADTVETFRNLLKDAGVGPRSVASDSRVIRSSKTQAGNSGMLKCRGDEFDARFFGLSNEEAEVMDPQQRLFLELVWEALEDANINPQTLRDSSTGVYVALWRQDYEKYLNQNSPPEVMRRCLSNEFFSTAPSISRHLGVADAFSASARTTSSVLHALHLACEELRSRKLSLAIVGGVNLFLNPSDDLAQASSSEAVGVLVLKSEAQAVLDNDKIIAWIQASSAARRDDDGDNAECIRDAFREAGIRPAEGFGSKKCGADNLRQHQIFENCSTNGNQAQIMGLAESSICPYDGTTELAWLMKLVLGMQDGDTEHCKDDLEVDRFGNSAGSQFLLRTWAADSKIATLNLLTLTEKICVVLQAPVEQSFQERHESQSFDSSQQLVVLSAKSELALEAMKNNLAAFLETRPSARLQDISFTLAKCRAQFTHRLAVVSTSTDELLNKLKKNECIYGFCPSSKQKVCFLFTGQGAQYRGMAKSLFNESPAFQKALSICAPLYEQALGQSLFEVIWENEARLEQTLFSQPAVFCIQYALTQFWKSHGVEPDVVLGHSAGEYAAAVAANALDLEQGFKLAVGRARLIDSIPEGAMLAVGSSFKDVSSLIQSFVTANSEPGTWIDVAAINSPRQTVVSARTHVILRFQQFCQQKEITTKLLRASKAFHSRDMDAILESFKQFARSSLTGKLTCKFVSSSRGAFLTDEELNPSYWAEHLRNPVQFSSAFELVRKECQILLEIGTQPVLLGIALNNMTDAEEASLTLLPSLRRNEDNMTTVFTSLAKLYVAGGSLELSSVISQHGSKTRLPTYPFQRENFWFQMPSIAAVKGKSSVGELPVNTSRNRQGPSTYIHSTNTGFRNAARIHLQIENFEATSGWIFTQLDQLYILFLLKSIQDLNWTQEWTVGNTFIPETWKERIPESLDPNIIIAYTQALIQSGYLSNEHQILLPLPTSAEADERIKALKLALDAAEANVDILMAYKFGDCLPDTLLGNSTGQKFLFPDDPAELGAARCYAESEAFQLSRALCVAEVVDAALSLAQSHSDQPVRILEVGSRSGETAWSIISKLLDLGLSVEYTYTDTSSSDLDRAREKLSRRNRRCKLYSLDVEPLSQNFAPNSFDLVLGSHVFHLTPDIAEAMRNLNQILCKGGRLIFTETLCSKPRFEFTSGMRADWWRFTDFRVTSPIVSPETWTRVLESTGFGDVRVFTFLDKAYGSISAVKLASVPNDKQLSELQKNQWFLFSDGSSLAEKIEQELSTRGRRAVSIEGADDLATVSLETQGQAEGLVYFWTNAVKDMEPLQGEFQKLHQLFSEQPKDQRPSKVFLVTRGLDKDGDTILKSQRQRFVTSLDWNSLDCEVRLIDLNSSISSAEAELVFSQLWTEANGDLS